MLFRSYDIGKFGDEYFSYVAAFGAFSWLSYTTDQKVKNVLGHTAYILDGIKDLSKIKPIHMRFTADGVVHEDDYIFGAVCNSLSIAGTIEMPKSHVRRELGRCGRGRPHGSVLHVHRSVLLHRHVPQPGGFADSHLCNVVRP